MLLTGRDADGNARTAIMLNNQGSFVEAISNLPDVFASAVALGDYDNDGDLDVVIMGDTGNGLITRIYRNESAIANTPPSTPTGLTATVDGDTLVTLSWNPASDAQSSQSSLTYNVRIGISTDPIAWAPPHALPDGRRQIVAAGNVGSNTTAKFKIDRLTAYYWSVQAIDGGFAGSAFAPEGAFGRHDSLTFFNVFPALSTSGEALEWLPISWVDYDNDGDLDLFTSDLDRIYRNDGNDTFTRTSAGSNNSFILFKPEWHDFDKDVIPIC